MSFTVEEVNFIYAAIGTTREDTIDNIFDVLPDIHDNDMKNIAESVALKLEKMSDTEFLEYDFKNNSAE